MDVKTCFDFYLYLSEVLKQNVLAEKNAFFFCKTSGIGDMYEVVEKYKKEKNFFVIDDLSDGGIKRINGGFFRRRVVTIYFLMRCSRDDASEKMAIVRELERQLISRLLVDREELSNNLLYLDVSNMPGKDVGEFFGTGTIGRYLMLTFAEPTEVCYNNAEWVTTKI